MENVLGIYKKTTTEKLEHNNDDAWVILNRQNATPKHVVWGTIPNVLAESREDAHIVESMLPTKN